MNKDNKFENTIGIESTYPKDMPKDHSEIPVWNAENWFYEDVIIDHKIRSLRRTISEGEAMEFNNVFALDRGLINGSKELFAVRENKLISLKINPIHYTETQAIVEGLVEGEEIISQPIIGAYNGMEINPVEQEQN